MSDDTPHSPGGDPTADPQADLRVELATTRRELRRLETRVSAFGDVRDQGSGQLVRAGAVLATVLMFFGMLMKVFIPVSGDDKSLTLFQVLDPDYDPDVLDGDGSWDTGPGWYVPIAMVVICIVLVISVAVSSGNRPGALVTVAQVFCWCLAAGCVLGFITLANSRGIVAVPGGLVTILVGGVVGALTCRLARS